MEKENFSIGTLIKEVLVKSGITDTKFANMIGKTRPYVYKIYEMEDMNTELLRIISKALNYNFFVDLAHDSRLGDIKANSIKMKNLSEWVINYVYEAIHGMHSDEPQAKDFNKWAKKFTRFDAEVLVWQDSLLELKSNGIEDNVGVSEIKATQHACNLIENKLQEWYLPKEEICFMKLNKANIDIIKEKLKDIPIILMQEAIFNLQTGLGCKDIEEIINKTIKVPIWVCPIAPSELLGEATIKFDKDCNIIGFKFDASQSTL